MPGTVENLRRHIQLNPQCLYLHQGEQSYFMARKFYNVTQQDCQQIQTLLQQSMDWVGDTKAMSRDTLPFLTYLVSGKTSLANELHSSNIAEVRQQKYR